MLIISLSPLFAYVTAALFLNEKITKLSLGLAFISIFGVYIMTLSKPEDSTHSQGDELFGYTCLMTSAVVYGIIFVLLRALALNNVSVWIVLFYFGCTGFCQTVILHFFVPGMINLQYCSTRDIFLLVIIGVSHVSGQSFAMLANKYTAASKIAPLSYTENVLTLLSDILIFHYHFVGTDIAGMSIIVF